MKLMTLSKRAVCCAFLTLLMAPLAVQAEPCELTKSKFGSWIGECVLQPRVAESISSEVLEFSETSFRVFRLKMPDLYADDGDYGVFGNAVQIEVRTGNSGQYASRDFDVTAEIVISYPNGTQYSTATVTGRVAGVDVGQRVRTILGTVTLPDRVSDWDLSVLFFVDSNNMANGGEVWEANETNNIFDDGVCRVYGSNPDVSVPPCQ